MSDMKRSLGLLSGVLYLIGFVSSSAAINIQQAEIDSGAVAVRGNQAARSEPITWEGVQVTTSNNGGVFKFTTSILPADCVGRLSDGVSAIEVVIENCMPALNRLLAPVPQTGQVKCYGRDTRISSCAGTGQDGELQKGVKLPTPRFTDNGNGTFTDNLTGLIWLKNAACLETVRPWLASLDAIVELNALGTMETHDCDDRSNNGTHQTDWRMPNIRELMSLLNYAFRRPAFSNAAGTDQAQCLPEVDCPFSNWQFSEIWSSTSVSDSDIDAGRAWQVNFAFGTADPLDKALPNGLLAVRGGS